MDNTSRREYLALLSAVVCCLPSAVCCPPSVVCRMHIVQSVTLQ